MLNQANKAVLDALVALHANMLAQDLGNQAERPTEEEFQACMAAASAAIRAATEEGAPAPADPMDWPLPCDVVIGHITMRKGLKLSALVKPMQVLYEMTEGASLAAQAELAVAVPSEAPAAQGDALSQAVCDVLAELERATRKFPTWPTDPLHALAVLGEEFGELTKDMLQLTYEPHKTSAANVRTEALQTAAMALRLYMSLDRYEYRPGVQHSQREGGST